MASLYDSASLVMIPSGYKEDKIYSIKPTDGSGDLTFSRSNDTATRVNSDGLIEKVRTNLLTYSQAFDNAAWSKTAIGITASAVANPLNGALTAQDATPTATLSTHRVLQTGLGGASSINTWSVYAKAKGYNFITIVENGNTGANVSFNLSTGTIGQQNSAVGQIQSLGNGWYRCSMIHTTAGTPRFDIYVSPTDSISAYTADGTSGVTLFGAQAELNDIATDYIPTTTAAVSVGPVANLPRLDYLGSSCPKLLLEPQRTNSQTYSEQINNAAWGLSGVTVSANNATSPDGYVNADKIVETAATARHEFYGSSLSFSGNNAVSFYAKYSGRQFICALGGGGGNGATFDLLNGTVGVNTAVSASIQSIGNGWYRCTVVINFTGSNQIYYILRTTADVGIDTYAGDGTSGVLFYGAQTELNAAYSTSYIPTLSAASTRGADAASKTGISSLIGQTEGTLFCDVEWTVKPEAGSPIISLVALNNTTNLQNCIVLGIERQSDGANRFYCLVQVSNSTTAALIGSNITNGRYKAALAYKENDFVLYVNGVQIATDTSGAVPTNSQVIVGGRFVGDSYQVSDPISQTLLFKTRLSNAELEALTTL